MRGISGTGKNPSHRRGGILRLIEFVNDDHAAPVGDARIACKQLSVIKPDRHPTPLISLVPASPPLHGDPPANKLAR